jgi:hypothetical protein
MSKKSLNSKTPHKTSYFQNNAPYATSERAQSLVIMESSLVLGMNCQHQLINSFKCLDAKPSSAEQSFASVDIFVKATSNAISINEVAGNHVDFADFKCVIEWE